MLIPTNVKFCRNDEWWQVQTASVTILGMIVIVQGSVWQNLPRSEVTSVSNLRFSVVPKVTDRMT